MQFIKYDLGYLKKGQIIQVNLSTQANVKLMDLFNFSQYKNMKNHKYYGGLALQNPCYITVPKDGQWFLTIDLGGRTGTIQHSVIIK